MKNKLVLVVTMFLVACFMFGVNETFAAKPADPAETKRGIDAAEDGVPTEDDTDKGSPMHGWKAIVAAGLKKGDTVTTGEFNGMRNWSASTRGFELRGLVDAGVLGRVEGKPGTYVVLVDVTEAQIDKINQRAIPVVKRTGIHGQALGIDSYRTDAGYLGAETVNAIRGIIHEVTGEDINTLDARRAVRINDNATALPASVFVNEDRAFTVAERTLESYSGVTAATNTRALLASLVDAGILPDTAQKGTGDTYNFTPVKINTVLFKEDFVTDDPEGFKSQFQELGNDAIAVIITEGGDKGVEAIRDVLDRDDIQLLSEWGSRIIVMEVTPKSTSAQAFARLFDDNSFYDLRDQSVEKILTNKNLVDGLQGAV